MIVPSPYLWWAKSRTPAEIDLAGSNLWPCTIDDLPGARDALMLAAPNDNGFAPLVNAIAAHYGVEPARVLTATGCSGANFIAIAALISAGDLVLVERPAYDPLLGACRLLGARVERIDRRAQSGWQFDLDDLRARLAARPRLLVITQPHNPSGTRLEDALVAALGRFAADAGTTVLVDEVYGDGANLAAPADAQRQSASRIDGPFVVTSSLTKSYGLAGLRCGWAIAPSAEMAERLRRTRDAIDNAGPVPSDVLGALAFTHLPAIAARSRRILSGNIARARQFFDGHPALELFRPPESSVVFPRIAGMDDAGPFVDRLREAHDTAVAPGHFFEAPAHFRLSLAGRPETLQTGLERLSDALGYFVV